MYEILGKCLQFVRHKSKCLKEDRQMQFRCKKIQLLLMTKPGVASWPKSGAPNRQREGKMKAVALPTM